MPAPEANRTAVVHDAFRAAIRDHRLLDGVERILVGFSGGSDSVALLTLCHELTSLETVAIHLNHGIRGADADADAQWCEQFCAARGIACECHCLDVPSALKPGESIEQAARRCRLAFWKNRAANVEAAALGHHLDDCLETLLMRLARGSNASGLTGPREKTTIGGVRFIRPLLRLRKSEIEDFLRDAGIFAWRQDRTNADPCHLRNAVRHTVIPMLQDVFGTDQGLVRSLQALREDATVLEASAAHIAADTLTPEVLHNTPAALQPRVLRLWLQRQLGFDAIPRSAAIERIRHELTRSCDHPRQIPLADGLSLLVDRAGIHIRGAHRELPTRTWHWDRRPTLDLPEAEACLTAELLPNTAEAALHMRNPDIEYFDAATLPCPLTVRGWEPGDALVPFGHTTPRKVKDVYIDAGVSAGQRVRHPIVAADSAILWVAGVRRAHVATVTDTRAACVALRYRRTR